MDHSERLAEQYLSSLNLGRVVYEPNGHKKPPDFSVAGNIGVEVRCLNENFEFHDGSYQSLEERSIPLWQGFETLLPTLGPSQNGECWYVMFDFERLLDKRRVLRRLIKQRLQSFMLQPHREPTTIKITENLKVDLSRADIDHGSFFELGGSCDDNSGGWVIDEFERNLRLCIKEKECKVAARRLEYCTWWLVLTDHISYGMALENKNVQNTISRIQHSFNRVILLDPHNHHHALEV
jgi:hypothetical protein